MIVINIVINKNGKRFNEYSETMSTIDGKSAGVTVKVEHNNCPDIYAYEYCHAVLNLFRRNSFSMKPRKFKELLKETLFDCSIKLSYNLVIKQYGKMPSLSGYCLSDDEIFVFCVGDGKVLITTENCKEKQFSQSSSITSKIKEIDIPSNEKINIETKTIKIQKLKKLTFFSSGSEDGIVIDFDKSPEIDKYHIFRAVITGTKHSDSNFPSQDYCDYSRNEDGSIIAAISDGASSAPFSEFSSIVNVNTFIDCLSEKYDKENFVKMFLAKFKNSFFTNYKIQHGCIEGYSTLAGVKIDEENSLVAHIGDGAVFGKKINGDIDIISGPDNVSMQKNRTHFTIENDAENHFTVKNFDFSQYVAVLLVSDGVYGPFAEVSDQIKFVKTVFDSINNSDFDDRKLALLIDTPEIRTYGDDHSAILIKR